MSDLVGNTKFFYVKFFEENKVTPAEPDEGTVKFILKDASDKIIEEVSLLPEHKIGVGSFRYPYVPTTAGNFKVEFKAYFNGYPAIGEVSKSFT